MFKWRCFEKDFLVFVEKGREFHSILVDSGVGLRAGENGLDGLEILEDLLFHKLFGLR